MLGLRACFIDGDLEGAVSQTFRVDGADLDAVVEDGDILIFAGDGGDGVGSHVVTDVLEVGDDALLFAGDETARPTGANIVKDGLTSGDEDLALPGVRAVGHSDVDLETRAVNGAFIDNKAESIGEGGGFVSVQHIEGSRLVENRDAVVLARQRHRGGAVGRVDADVLEADAQVGLHVDGSEVRRAVVNGDEGTFGRKDFNRDDFGHLVVTNDSQGCGAHFVQRVEVERAVAVDDGAGADYLVVHHHRGDAESGILSGDLHLGHAKH